MCLIPSGDSDGVYLSADEAIEKLGKLAAGFENAKCGSTGRFLICVKGIIERQSREIRQMRSQCIDDFGSSG